MHLIKTKHGMWDVALINLLSSKSYAFILGCNISKSLRMMDSLNMATITRQTYHSHQRKYLSPTLRAVWKTEREAVLEELRQTGNGLVLSGDGRSDSPGYSAKFGTYVFVEESTKKVVDFQIVQVNIKAKYLFHLTCSQLKIRTMVLN